MKVYFSKQNPNNWQIVPAPSDLENFYTFDIEDVESLYNHDVEVVDGALKLTPVAPPEPPSIDVERMQCKAVIDNAAADAYEPFSRFSFEYERRLAQAEALEQSNYESAPGAYVQSLMDSSGLDAKAAVASIKAANTALNAYADALQACRMEKFKLDKITTIEELKPATDTILEKLKGIVEAFKQKQAPQDKADQNPAK